MIDIFVNYRRSDQAVTALLIDQALTARLGDDRVFLDHRAIQVGTTFPPEIWSAIQECRVLVAVIGARWLEPDADGNRRIDDPDDYVRREIAEALRRDITVVPVLVDDANLPDAADLPPDLAGLPLRQYRTVRVRGLDHDVARLADELAVLVGGRALPDRRDGDAGAVPTTTNNFHAPVDARKAVFGVVNNNR
jgi:hypothetical protein